MDEFLTTAEGYRRDRREAVDSTNTAALNRAHTGDAGNLWVTATSQSVGRGRSGRHWVSEPGNLYASLLLIDPAPAEKLSQLALVAAVALARAVENSGRIGRPVNLKWPNDLLIDGRKVSGILLESAFLSGKRTAVVIGCGVNIRHHPDKADYPTTCLQALGGIDDPESLFPALARSAAETIAQWSRGAGFADIRSAWLARAIGLGEPIRVRMTDRVLAGRFHDLDAQGRLIVEGTAGKRTTVSAGDVFFGGSASGASLQDGTGT